MHTESFFHKLSKIILLLITALYFVIQITLQYPSTFTSAFNFVNNTPLRPILHGLQLNLTLSHMFAPFETSVVATRIRYIYNDGHEYTQDRTAYRAPFRRSLANLIESRFVVRSSNQSELPQDVFGFLAYQCKTRTNLSSIEFEKATISIEPILNAHGSYTPHYLKTLVYNCSDLPKHVHANL